MDEQENIIVDINRIFEKLVEKLNENERKNYSFGIWRNNSFFFCENVKKDKKSLKIKIIEERKKVLIDYFKEIVKEDNLDFEIKLNKNYCSVYRIGQYENYLIFEYVVNSHVQIPQCILKNFLDKNVSDKSKCICFIDMEDYKIKNMKIKEFDAEYGHYSKWIEEYFCKECESIIGNLKQEINSFARKKIHEIDLELYVNSIKNVFMLQLYRNPKFLEEINQKSLTSIIVGGYKTEDIIFVHHKEKFENIFNEKEINILINKTDEGLVTTKSTISMIKVDKGNEALIMPLHPKFAIVLLEKDYYQQKYMNEGKTYYMSIDSIKEVQEMNKRIFDEVKKNKKEAIIGIKTDLDILTNYIK